MVSWLWVVYVSYLSNYFVDHYRLEADCVLLLGPSLVRSYRCIYAIFGSALV